MKKLLYLLIVFLIASFSFADNDHNIQEVEGVSRKWQGLEVGSGVSSEYVVNLDTMKPQGFASLQVEISGSGALRIYHESSNDNGIFNTAIVNGTAASDVVGSMLVGSAFYVFDVPLCKYLKVYFEEVSDINTVTVTKAVLVVQ